MTFEFPLETLCHLNQTPDGLRPGAQILPTLLCDVRWCLADVAQPRVLRLTKGVRLIQIGDAATR
ncbi:MAG: hypothetical protein AAGI13_00720 [Pseudomonadota bacterium]